MLTRLSLKVTHACKVIYFALKLNIGDILRRVNLEREFEDE